MSAPSRFFRPSASLFEAAKASTGTISSPKSSSRSAKTPASKDSASLPKSVDSATPSRPTGNSKAKPVSAALSSFLGGDHEASRTGSVKKVWKHIKLNNMQNMKIHCDYKLKAIFDGKDTVGFPEIAKLLNRHFEKVY